MLSSEHSELRETALDGLVRMRFQAAVPRLLEELKNAEEPLARGLVEALGRLTDERYLERVQPRLIELLSCDAGPLVREVVIALGRVGDRQAVGPLRKRQGVYSGIYQEIERAITAIQHRNAGGERGQISLVEVQSLSGALSPAKDRAGRGALSKAEKRRKRRRKRK